MIKRLKIVFAFFVVFVCNCTLASFLTPAKFPKTFDELTYTAKQEFKAEDYDRYKDLTPYEQLILDYADKDIERQIAEDLANQSAQQSAQQSGQQSGQQTPQTIITNNAASAGGSIIDTGAYCQMRQPNIPQNQKIPFGTPVLHEHFIYCAPYARVNRGAGCRWHTGYDIGCNRKDKTTGEIHESYDDPVFTTADGVVKFIGRNAPRRSAGNYILIDHGNGFQTYYMHLNKIFVSTGQSVSAGCQIGTIGNTGSSLETINGNPYPTFSKSLAHVHYEMHYRGNSTSVVAGNGQSVLVTHGAPGKAHIDPTQFLCTYNKFPFGYCGATYPYQSCP